MKVLEKSEDVSRRQIIYWNIFNRSYQGYLKVLKPKREGLKDLQTCKGQKFV